MTEKQRAVFKVVINGSLDDVWRELTKTDEVQQAMFNARLHTPGLEPGAPLRMRSADGKFTAVAGTVIAVEERARLSHTFRFTSFDDPPCTVTYDLKEVEGGVEFTLTVDDIPIGTKTEKQMRQGGTFITNTMKSIIETGRPSLSVRLLYLVFKLMAPFNPKRLRSENWGYDVAV